MLFLKEFIRKVYFENNQQTTKKYEKHPVDKELRWNYFASLDKDGEIFRCQFR